ncbi:MAG: MFS transporter [Phycisphaerales bacterium]|nr:MFS transporter [Phycisphaerales bacterium]
MDIASHTAPRASNTWGILGVTVTNSLATGVLWNGLGFITSREYHYSASETYALFIAAGALYALTAFFCGRVLARLAGKMTPRQVLIALCAIQALVAPLAYVSSSSAGVIVVVLVTSMTGACLWPIVESYVAAGRTPHETRRAVGKWCIAWMIAVALSLVLMGPLQRNEGWMNPRFALVALAPLSLISIGFTFLLPSHPGHHAQSSEQPPAHYIAQLKSARILLPASYLLVGALNPLMPYVLDRLEMNPTYETPLTAVWLTTRVVVAGLMLGMSTWRGRWTTLLLGALFLVVGFATVVTAPSLGFIAAGLVLFGAGHGVIYYAALYYALRVGSASIEAGGTHEALIGLGYVVGPAAGLAGFLLGGGGWTVAVVCALLAVAAVPAALPWINHRKAHRAQSV